MEKIGRALVCLLLVCCLLFNISPIRAKAVGAAAAVTISVAATTAIAAALIACGVSQGESPTDFDYAVDACKQWLAESTEWLTDGGAAALAWVSGTVYASAQFVDDVRTWLFDSGIVSVGSGWGNAEFLPGGSSFSVVSLEDVSVVLDCDTWVLTYYTYSIGDEKTNIRLSHWFLNPDVARITGSWLLDGKSYSISSVSQTILNGVFYRCYERSGSLSYPNGDARITELLGKLSGYTFVEDVSSSSSCLQAVIGSNPPSEKIETSLDLVVASLVAPSVSIATGYADWAAGAITVPGSVVGVDEEEETLVYPLGLGQTYEDTKGMTQADVWTGTGTYVDTKTEALTGTFADTAIGTFINSLIDALWTPIEWIGAQIAAVPAAITDFFTFTTDLSAYAVELTSFFPFCIPWDIYNFFALFQAEPEAPHFEWDIPFPYMDEPWHVEIDLSAWDSVAGWLRAVELIGFIIGLALVTREKFLRG